MVAYVDAMTVMCVLLFLLHVCMLRECEGDENAGMGPGDLWVYGWYTWFRFCVYFRRRARVSLVRGVGGVCEMCLARGRVGGVGARGLGLGFTNPVGTWDVCCVAVLWVAWTRVLEVDVMCVL